MSLIRTYFDKNNTIISGTKEMVNTGRNPVSELFYGTNISRFLFFVDFNALRQQIADKMVNPSTIIRHTLKMKNTNEYDVLPYRDYRDKIQFSNESHATSFDLELQPVYEDWDEGIGYDFQLITALADENALVNGNSNWLHRTAQDLWTYPGAVSGTTGTTGTTICTQHFDKGNEDLEMDITPFINEILSGATYSGLCLKYTDFFESTPEAFPKTVAFFTRHTNTFFEPFIETEYDDLVQDDRANFVLDKVNHLVLFAGGMFGDLMNLDNLPTCTISGVSYPVTQISKGVYSAEVMLPSSTYSDSVMYTDVWSDIVYNGIQSRNSIRNFVPKPPDEIFQFNETFYEPVHYGISINGIKREEMLKQGERRKIFVNLRKPYTVEETVTIGGLYYRMYVKQGVNQITVIDWTPVNRGYFTHYFLIDTSWLIPQQYFIDIKVVNRDEVNIYNEETRFTVINSQ